MLDWVSRTLLRKKTNPARCCIVRPAPRLTLERLEDRVTPTVTFNLTGGTLEIQLSAAGDTVDLSASSGTGTVSALGTGDATAQTFTNVTGIAVQPGSMAVGPSQTVTFLDPTPVVTGSITVTNVGTVVASSGLTAGSISVSGATQVELGQQILSTTGAQTYQSPVTLTANTRLTANTGATVTLASTVNGDFSLEVDGPSVFAGALGSTTPLTGLLAQDGTVSLGANVTTTGAQTYQSPVLLTASVDLSCTGGSSTFVYGNNDPITFVSTVDGAHALQVEGPTDFDAAVGGTTSLASLQALAGTVYFGGGALTTTGSQTYQSSVSLFANTTLTATGNTSTIAFQSQLNGLYNLIVDGNSAFDSELGESPPLNGLETTGLTTFSGGIITANTENFGPILVTGFTQLEAGTGVFATINGAARLAIEDSNQALLTAAVGASTPLTIFSVSGGPVSTSGPVTLTASTSVTLVGAIDPSSALTLATPLVVLSSDPTTGAFVVNDRTHQFSSGNSTVALQGVQTLISLAGGSTRADLYGSTSANAFFCTPLYASLQTPDLLVQLLEYGNVYALGGAGVGNTATLSDPGGANTFTGDDDGFTLQTAQGGTLSGNGFPMVTAFASASSTDTAWLYDTSGSNTFCGTSTYATFQDAMVTDTVIGYASVNAVAAAGTSDTAYLDGGSGTNTLVANAAVAHLQGSAFAIAAYGFTTAAGYGSPGASNVAALYSGPGSNTFQASPVSASLQNSAFSVSATGFGTVSGYGSPGASNVAGLYGGPAGGTFAAYPTASFFSGVNCTDGAVGFATVYAVAAPASVNAAYLTGTAGSDAFSGTGTIGSFTASTGATCTIGGFTYVTIVTYPGGYSQTEVAAILFSLTESGPWHPV